MFAETGLVIAVIPGAFIAVVAADLFGYLLEDAGEIGEVRGCRIEIIRSA